MSKARKHKYDVSDNLQEALFKPQTSWSAPANFPNLSDEKVLGIDIESHDPELKTMGPGFIRKKADVVGVSLATLDKSWYFPIGHFGGGNLDKDIVSKFLQDTLKSKATKVFANASYDLEGLWALGVKCEGKIHDIIINDALLDEERDLGFSLDDLNFIHLGTRKNEDLLKEAASAYNVDPKSGLWKLPAKYVGPYAEYDAFSTLQIFNKQLKKLHDQDLMQIFDLESRLIPLVHEMRIQGCPVDLEAAHTLSTRLKSREMSLRHDLYKECGKHINDQSATDLVMLCTKYDIHFQRTEAGNPSFEGEWLENHQHPIMQKIAEIRQLAKNRDDYVEKIIAYTTDKGRIHISWKQMLSEDGGTRTGRFAAGNPPLQQFPSSKKKNGKPNEIGKAIRALLVPPTGQKWFKSDYSQQEPRILVHFAALCKLAGAEAAAFTYRSNPDTDFYKLIMEICSIERRPAKTTYLAITYGQGLESFARDLGKPKEVAKKSLEDFNSRLPFISLIAEKCKHLAQSRGYVKTLCGRKRHFNYYEPRDAFEMRKTMYSLRGRNELTPKLAAELDTTPRLIENATKQWPGKQLMRAYTQKALNALIQGSAADMIKAALVKGYEEDKRVPFITVHDEVGGGVINQEDANKWKYTMENCVNMSVPIKADVTVCDSWR